MIREARSLTIKIRIGFLLPGLLLAACQPQTVANGPIRIASEIERGIEPGYTGGMYDLDGMSDTLEASADIEFLASGGSMIFFSLLPINGASAVFYGPEEPGPSGCSSEIQPFTKSSIPQLPVGSFICLLTNQGRLVQLEVLDLRVTDRTATIDIYVQSLDYSK